MDSRRFLPSFAEIGKAELTKQVRAIHREKKVVILPLSLWLLKRYLANNFICRSLFPHFPFLCQVLSKSVQFSRRYIRKYLPDSVQYLREAP